MDGSVTVVTSNDASKIAWEARLTELLRGKLRVNTLKSDQLHPGEAYSDDLVVIVPGSLESQIVTCLAPETKYIIGQRTLNLENIHKLSAIPPGSDVVVLNDTTEYAVEIARELESFGFTQFHYHSFNDIVNDQWRDFKYGITTGEGHLMPHLDLLIDLGPRQISISTISEILGHFYGRIQLDDHLFTRYIASHIQTSVSLDKRTRDNETLRRHLSAIVADFDEGVVLFNRNHEVLVSNRKAAEKLQGDPTPEILTGIIPREWDYTEQFSCFTQFDQRPLYITLKKLDNEEATYMATLSDVSNIQSINKRYKQLQRNHGLSAVYTYDDILAKSDAMLPVIASAKSFARSDANILVTGESGTGKELLAQSIHNASTRSTGPFVAINCGALSDALLESELFGYEEGAFTGANKGGKRGLFEAAHQGTLFLDEIGDASLAIQQKLLRVIQEKEVVRVSGVKPIFVDVKIISATNKSLLREVENGTFRRDLFYRLNVMTLRLSALRERSLDMIYLFNSLLHKKLSESGIRVPEEQMDDTLYSLLQSHNWPGNVREMENLTEAIAHVLATEKDVRLVDHINNYWHMLYADQDDSTIPSMRASVRPIQPSSHTILHHETAIVLSILASLEDCGHVPGRSAVLRECRRQSIPLTEQQIKLRIKKLIENGFLEKGPGYRNTLTAAGREMAHMATKKQPEI